MRIRTVKPEFWKNEELAQLPEFTRLMALALLNYSDDEGYFEADHRLIRGALFPFDEDSARVQRAISELSNAVYVKLFNGTNGRVYGLVVNFKKHQKIDRPSPSRIKPLINFDEPSASPQRVLGLGTGIKEQGKGSGTGNPDSSEPPAAPVTPSRTAMPVLSFPCVGNPAEWILTDEQVAEWSGVFTAVNVAEECRLALAWVKANPVKKKTAKGMLRFLYSWLAKCQNRGGSSPLSNRPAGSSKPATVWELQQCETAIKDRMRDLMEGHKGMNYVGLKPGSTNPYEWTEKGKAEYDRLQTDLAAVRAQLAQRPAEDREND